MASFLSTLFSGGAEKEAADKNRAALGDYTQSAYGALGQGLDRSVTAATAGVNSANGLLQNNAGLYDQLRTAGNGILDQGRAGSLAALNSAGAAYDPLSNLAGEYGRGRSLYQDSLGINGAGGNANAVSAFQAGPGYQWQLDQGLQATDRARAARGMLNSGNTTQDEIRYGQGLANQEYGSWQNRLQGFVPLELQATQGAAQGRAGVQGNIANLYQNDAQQRLGLEQGVTQGQAGANVAQGANDVALGNSLAGLYTGDATNRVGVAGNNYSGQASANNMQAAGEAAGAKNGLNAALGLASLAMGMPGAGSFGSLGGAGPLSNLQRFGMSPIGSIGG